MAKKQRKTIEETAKVGEEVVVKVGDASLVCKVGDGFILPDFADAFARTVEKNTYAVLLIVQRYLHKQIDETALRSACAGFRDSLFNDIIPDSASATKEDPGE